MRPPHKDIPKPKYFSQRYNNSGCRWHPYESKCFDREVNLHLLFEPMRHDKGIYIPALHGDQKGAGECGGADCARETVVMHSRQISDHETISVSERE